MTPALAFEAAVMDVTRDADDGPPSELGLVVTVV